MSQNFAFAIGKPSKNTSDSADSIPVEGKGVFLFQEFDPAQIISHLDLGSTQVIMLGEERHGQEDVIALNCELIKKLHEEHGFNTLLLESDAWNLVGYNTLNTREHSIYKVWSETAPFLNLLNYIDSTGMQLYGIDSKIYNKQNNEAVLQHIREHTHSTLAETELLQICAVVEEAIEKEFETSTPDQELNTTIEALEKIVAKNDTSLANYRIKIVVEYLKLIQIERQSPDQYIEQREYFMANNTQYLLNHRSKDHKVIILGASMHTQPGATILSKHAGANVGDKIKTMNLKSLSIQTLVGEGEYRVGNSDQIVKIEKPKRKSIRKELVQQKVSYALLDLTQIAQARVRLYNKHSRPDTFGDYILFLKHTKATTRR